MKKLGFACKKIDNTNQINGIGSKDPAKQYNTSTTTVAWLSKQSKTVSENKLLDIILHNLSATYNLVKYVSQLDSKLRLVRLSSDILPVYTHNDWSYFYKQPSIISILESQFLKIGNLAKSNNVRLSFHPGQFCCLASHNSRIVDNSIAEFEYHADMVRYMGYGKQFQDFKINIHLSGKLGTIGFRNSYQRLSNISKNCITVENDEFTNGLESCLELSDICPVVLDLHHYWIKENEYFLESDSRIKSIRDSWRGIVPVIHYSQSREDTIPNQYNKSLLDMSELLSSGIKKQKLRAHSDFYYNDCINAIALKHLSWADIMCESKSKNLGVQQLFKFLQ